MNTVSPNILQTVFKHSLIPSIIVKADSPRFTIIDSNDQHKLASNTTEKDLKGMGLWEAFDPRDKRGYNELPIMMDGLNQAINQKIVVKLPVFRYDILSSDEECFNESYWKVEIIPVIDQNIVECLVITTQNVTQQEQIVRAFNKCVVEKTQLEESFQDSTKKVSYLNEELEKKNIDYYNSQIAHEERFKSMLESIPQITWTSRPDGSVSYYNQRWFNYTGLTKEESNENIWASLLHPEDLKGAIEAFTAIKEKCTDGEFESRLKRGDGVYRWHLNRLVPLTNNTGQVDLWIGTATDIDDIKQLHRQKDEFISLASHELKTPVTVLKVNLEVMKLLKHDTSAEMLSSMIDHCNRSIKRITDLIEDLLHATTINHDKLHLKYTRFKLADAIDECCHPIRIINKYNILVEGNHDLVVEADENRIAQVISNLVDNAIKYSREAKDIVIAISKSGNNAKLSVKDSGSGISSEHLPHLFDRYYRVDATGITYAGLGLGLYLSSEIVKKHGGEIGVESMPGKGSNFWFTIPLKGESN